MKVEKGKWYLIRHGYSDYRAKCLEVYDSGAYVKIKCDYLDDRIIQFSNFYGEIDNPTILYKIKRVIAKVIDKVIKWYKDNS